MKNKMLLGLTSLFMPCISNAESMISREDLFRKPSCMAIKISPDARQLAYVGASEDGTMNIYLSNNDLSLEGANQATQFTEPEIKNFYWSPDSKKILIQKDKDGTRQFRLYLLDVNTLEVRDLTSAYKNVNAKVFQISSIKNTAVIGINARNPALHDLYLLDMTTGDLSLIYKNDEFIGFLFDDHLQIALKLRMNPDCSTVLLDKNDVPVLNINAEDAFHSGYLKYVTKDDALYLLDNRGTDTTQFKKIFINSKKPEILFGHDPLSDIQDVIFDGDTPIAYANYYTYKEWHPLNEKSKMEFDHLISKLGANFGIASQSANNKFWIIDNDIPEKGHEFWLYNRDSKELKLLYSYPNLNNLSKMYPLVIPTKDGLQLVCYLTLPKEMDCGGRPNKPLPLVVFPHGGPFKIRDTYKYSPKDQWLANRGYAVLSVNFRASSGFGKSFVNAGNSQWGKKSHQDILDAVQWCINEKIAEEGKIGVFGGSYGGYVALSSLTFTPDAFACAVAICGPSDLKTVLEKCLFYWEFPSSPFSESIIFFTKNAFIKSIGGDPEKESDLPAIASSSPINYINNIKKPLLLIHGANDPIVKASESDQIFEKLQEHQLPALYISFADEGHGVTKFVNSMCYLAYSEWLFAKYLGGNYQPIDAKQLQLSSCNIQSCNLDPDEVKIPMSKLAPAVSN